VVPRRWWGFPTGLGVADSPDGGKTWWKYAGNPVWGARGVPGEAGGQPWVYREGPGLYWLYTTYSDSAAGDSAAVQIAKSSDGLNWTNVSVGAVPLPSAHDARPAADRSVTGTMFGNRAVWKEAEGTWHMLQVSQTLLLLRYFTVLPVLTTNGLWSLCLQECGTSEGVWEIFLYSGSSPTSWRVRAGPLRTLQRHARSMFGGCHIATIDGQYMPKDPSTGRYNIWYHAGTNGDLPTDSECVRCCESARPQNSSWLSCLTRAAESCLLRSCSLPCHLARPTELDGRPHNPCTLAPWHGLRLCVRPGVYDHLLHSVSTAPTLIGSCCCAGQVADPSPLTVGDQAFIFYDGDDNRPDADMHAAIGMASAHAGGD
jgi:hypothetical protein